MTSLWARRPDAIRRLDARLSRHRILCAAAVALALSALCCAYNLTGGPLSNLNDIGGWRPRLAFTLLTAAAQGLLLLLCALLCREGALRAALRQAIVTAGFMMMLLAINQKSYAYTQTVQPIVRAMDGGGLAAGLNGTLSAPAATLLYLVTRGPIYDMYLAKLFAIACAVLLALLAARAAEAMGASARAEAALTLCLILPQGFMSAACCADGAIASALLLGASLLALRGANGREGRPLLSALLFGGAVALHGAALCALPLYLLRVYKRRMRPKHLAAALLPLAAGCLPAILCGMSAPRALLSPLRAFTCAPAFASGAPGLFDLFPRALVEEMEGAPMLARLPEIDAVTNAAPYYTQAHWQIAMRGLSVLAPALLLGAWALALRARGASPLQRTLALAAASLFACPGASAGAWVGVAALCVLAILLEPGLRPPACVLLFATAGAAVYPLTGETLLPPLVAMGIAFVSILSLLGVLPCRPEGRDG